MPDRPDPGAAGVFGAGPAVIGHRGLGRGTVAGHRENTLGSFTAAARLGMTWVEADIRRTGDDVLVVEHDAAYPDGARVADLPVAAVDQRGTMRLDTLLEQLPPGVGLNVDLKSSMDDSLRPPARTTAGLLATMIAAEAGRRPMVVSSFDPGALLCLRTEAPRVPLAWLTWLRFPLDAAVAGCAHMDVEVLGLHVGSLRRDAETGALDRSEVARAVSLVHGGGRQLLVWCPEAGAARMLVEAGADAVVVDEVPRALDGLRRAG